MIFSLSLVFLVGLTLGGIARRLRLPSLLGMLFTGILLGPFVLDLLDPSLLGLSAELRRIALLIILTRAGLSLDLADLRRNGRPALLLCFVPACFEIAGVLLLAPLLLGFSLLDAAILGTVLAAVSPAVIVPKMLSLMEQRYGTKQGIPQMVMAGASVDDVFVIVLFTAFTGVAQGGSFAPMQLLQIPASIVLGALVGLLTGGLLSLFFEKVHLRDSIKVLILLAISGLLITLETAFTGRIPFSGLLAVMCCGIGLLRCRPEVAQRMGAKYAKLWVAAEVLLFVLVGATADPTYIYSSGLQILAVIFGALCFRGVGVLVALSGSRLQWKERFFVVLAYMPKATVQAAIGGLPLAMGLSCGPMVLTAAVLSILLTAPLGALAIDATYRHLLTAENLLGED